MRQKQASIRQLEYFVTVARSPNFRKAAARLNVSQPTLTSQIAALEELIGTQLFERSRAGTLLSPAGRELLPLARNTLEHYQQFVHYADNTQKEVSGVFKLGVSSTLGPYLLPRILPELRDIYPKLKLHIREASPEALEKGLAEGSFDLILTVLPLNAVEYQVRALFVESDPVEVGAEFTEYVELLKNLARHPAVKSLKLDVQFDNLREISWRLSELLPVSNNEKQTLLEQDDPLVRLEQVELYMAALNN